MEQVDAIDKTIHHNFNFIGSIYRSDIVRENRLWVLDFASEYFQEPDFLKVTDVEYKDDYVPLGEFDYSLDGNKSERPNKLSNLVDKDYEPVFDEMYWTVMAQSNFTLSPAGDRPGSSRHRRPSLLPPWQAAALHGDASRLASVPAALAASICLGQRGLLPKQSCGHAKSRRAPPLTPRPDAPGPGRARPWPSRRFPRGGGVGPLVAAQALQLGLGPVGHVVDLSLPGVGVGAVVAGDVQDAAVEERLAHLVLLLRQDVQLCIHLRVHHHFPSAVMSPFHHQSFST